MNKYIFSFLIIISILISSCEVINEVDSKISQKKHLVNDIAPYNNNGELNAVIEIPAGTIEKWEVNKQTGELDIEKISGEIRKIDYLPYPGNYGMIPQTLLPKSLGGDGDPLDIIILGPAGEKGSIVNCKLIGVLKLLDRGEQDDKLIAVQEGTKMFQIENIKQLDAKYFGILNSIETWFINYKGKGKMQPQGFGSKEEAQSILDAAIKAYKEK